MPRPVRPSRPGEPVAGRRLRALRRSQRRLRGEPTPGPEAAPTARPSADAPAAGEPAGPTRTSALRRLWRSLVRPGRAQVTAAVILFVVGMGAVMQIRINTTDDAYTSARREDLIQLLDGLGSESRRLEAEIADLERTRVELESGADTRQVARAEAQQRREQLAILAGTAPAEGPGIRMRIERPRGAGRRRRAARRGGGDA